MAAPHTLHAPAPTTTEHATSSDPRVSGVLMIVTYAAGGVALFLSFWASTPTTAAYWASAGAVGVVGVLSFVRHSVFHRSDAARMGWDYGRRNDFQIEVGFANLALGVAGILAWALSWGSAAAGAVTIAFGAYLAGAALLHGSELRRSGSGSGHLVTVVATAAYAVLLLVAGAHALS
jgi:hypothetical protein